MTRNIQPEQSAQQEVRSLQRRTYHYAFWVVLLLATGVAVALYYFGKDSPYKADIYSIASGLVSSIIFSIFFTLLTNREFETLIKREIRSEQKATSDHVIREVSRYFSSYVPADLYNPTPRFDEKFNRDITRDLHQSSFYLFRGISAKYVPPRVLHCRNILSVLKVMIIDPRDSKAINLRAKDRSRNPKYSGTTVGQLADNIRKEIYMSIIGLFDCRYTCPVEIAYSAGTSVVRLEIFDESLYMALYHIERASGQAFPETVRYLKSSIVYNLYRLDSFREFDLADDQIRFYSSHADDFLLQHLISMGMLNVTQGVIDQYRAEYKQFSDDFVRGSGISRF